MQCSPALRFPLELGLVVLLHCVRQFGNGSSFLPCRRILGVVFQLLAKRELTLRRPGSFISWLLLYPGKSRSGYKSPQQGPTLPFGERPRSTEAFCPCALAVEAAAYPPLCASGSRGAGGGSSGRWGRKRGSDREVAGAPIHPRPATWQVG